MARNGLEQADQLRRLGRFRAQHPGVVINRVGNFGFWQAWIPEGNGGTFTTRYVQQYPLADFPQFWMARESFELNILAEGVFAGTLLSTSDGVLDKASLDKSSGHHTNPPANSSPKGLLLPRTR